jgi:ferredoxin
MSVVVRIDPTLCRGHAICALHLAGRVEIDRWGYGRIVTPALEDRRDVRRALRAAAACPNQAITVQDEDPIRSGADPRATRIDW